MNGPIEPSADTRAFAKQMRDIYLALTLEGFTTAEALQIIAVMLSSAWRGPS